MHHVWWGKNGDAVLLTTRAKSKKKNKKKSEPTKGFVLLSFFTFICCAVYFLSVKRRIREYCCRLFWAYCRTFLLFTRGGGTQNYINLCRETKNDFLADPRNMPSSCDLFNWYNGQYSFNVFLLILELENSRPNWVRKFDFVIFTIYLRYGNFNMVFLN